MILQRTFLTVRSLIVMMGCIVLAGLAADPAFAAGAAGFGKVQENISTNIVYIPRVVAILAYVIGTFFALSGLLKLKDWMHDSERNTLNAVIFRLVVSALLIFFPYIWAVINTSLFGTQANGNTMDTTNTHVLVPKLSVFEKAN